MIRRFLATIAGARYDILQKTPVDRFRYVAMGGVLLTTAAVAAVSASFALVTAVKVPPAVGIVAGVAWGIVILNLDRLLIVSMTRRSGWWRNIFAALPRLLLAFLLGTVISTPLVLRIFEPEINAELVVLQNQRKAEFDDALATNPQYAEIPELESQLADAQADANRSPEVAVAADPGVIAAKAKVKTTGDAYAEAQRLVQCEIDGVADCGGTGVPGVAESARERIRARDVALRDYNAALDDQAAAEAVARTAAGEAAATARQEADRLTDELTRRRDLKKGEQAGFAAIAANDDGLLSRIEALGSLGDKRGDLWLAQLVLFFLFLSLEVLPVLVKLMQLGGRLTLYEQLIEKMEESAKRSSTMEIVREESISRHYAERQHDLELDQADRQFDAGLRANDMLVARQAAIAEKAIERWSAEAEVHSDREITNWFSDMRRSNGNPVPPRQP